jgi:predicted aldo/keto reductase-like oxidoreductase
MMPSTSLSAARLSDLSKYIYGTTRLGDASIPVADRVKIARAAMESGVWFHTSHTYGDALSVLRAAFDEDRNAVPRMIFKIGWSTIPEMRDMIQQNIGPLGVEYMDIGQLCLSGELADHFRNGGKSLDDLRRIKEDGLARRYLLEVFPWTSQIALDGLLGGHADGIVDGYIFYLNPLQRFASNTLWDLIQQRGEPIIAMRTVSGGNVHRLRDVPGAAWKDYLRQRAVEVAPIFEKSGIPSWPEFCVRFAFGFPLVRATVGATSRLENLREFLNAARRIEPLRADIQSAIVNLQYRWSDETDIHAEQWSM